MELKHVMILHSIPDETGINRTSVELKRNSGLGGDVMPNSINRTSVELKHRQKKFALCSPICINRTSVELKPRGDRQER